MQPGTRSSNSGPKARRSPLAGQNDHAKVAFGTEAGLFQRDAQIPCVTCGPGSIAQAHKPDEYLSLDQLAAGQAFMGRLADRVCVK